MIMVHSSLRAIGPIRGGVNVILEALLNLLGPQGTLLAYVDFEPFYEDVESEEVPVFDKRIAHAARDHGVLHETLRNWPGALRSDHPDAGVVAVGAKAAWLTHNHPFQYGYGEGSPFEKFAHSNGQVLMLGAPLDTITLLHYAEHKAQIPDKRILRYRRRMPAPASWQWIEFEEFDTSEPVNDLLPQNCFELIAQDYLAQGRGRSGLVGEAPSYLFDGSDLTSFGIQWLEQFFATLNTKP
jgi:aminoglycoside 3-N-acetyltransferase